MFQLFAGRTSQRAIRRVLSVVLLSALLLPLCLEGPGARAENSKALSSSRTVLRVMPYPDIPGSFAEMLRIVETGFEARYPDIDLELVTASVEDVYETAYLAERLSNATQQGGVHIAEIDTIMLGDLAQSGLLREQGFRVADWHPLIEQAVAVDGVQYGVPHWLCGNFLISRHPEVTQALSVEDLARRIRAIKPKAPWLAGNYAGSSYLVLYYTQAWGQDRPGVYDLQPAITDPVDLVAVRHLAMASGLCTENGVNPCVDGTYYADFAPIFERTVRGDYAALQGFSESMWYMMQYGANPEEWYISPLPVGLGNRNVLLGDAYVARRDLDPAVARAAEAFYAYMMEYDTYAAIIFSGGPPVDAHAGGGAQVPRYLAPARLGMFAQPGLAQDAYYQRVLAAMVSEDGTNYPNLHVPENRERIYESVMPFLDGTIQHMPRRGMMPFVK